MATFLTVPQIEGIDGLLELLTNPKKGAEYLEKAIAIQQENAKQLERYKAITDIDKYQSLANEKMQLAKQVSDEADNYKAATIQEMNRLTDETRKRIDAVQQQLDKRGADLESLRQVLVLKEQELIKREEAAARDLKAAEKRKADADGSLNRGLALQEEYSAKLRKLKELS